MKVMALLAVPLMMALALPSTADAASRKKAKRKPVAVEMANSEPRARIRADRSGAGLTPLEFAAWLRAHPRLASDIPKLRNTAATTRTLNRVAEHFVAADRNRDGRVSAQELADFVQPQPESAMGLRARTT